MPLSKVQFGQRNLAPVESTLILVAARLFPSGAGLRIQATNNVAHAIKISRVPSDGQSGLNNPQPCRARVPVSTKCQPRMDLGELFLPQPPLMQVQARAANGIGSFARSDGALCKIREQREVGERMCATDPCPREHLACTSR